MSALVYSVSQQFARGVAIEQISSVCNIKWVDAINLKFGVHTQIDKLYVIFEFGDD